MKKILKFKCQKKITFSSFAIDAYQRIKISIKCSILPVKKRFDVYLN